MNIAALLGTSGNMPDRLGKAVTAGANSPEFRQVLKDAATGEAAPDAPAPPQTTTAGAAPPPSDLLSALLKLFDKGLGQEITPDPTGEALDAEQDETKASLTELMAALQPLVGQSTVTLAAGNAAQQPEQPATNSTSTQLQSQQLLDAGKLVLSVTTPTLTNQTQPAPMPNTNTTPIPQNFATTLAQQAAVTSDQLPTPTSQSNPDTSTTPSTNSSTAPTFSQALPATGEPAAGATNELDRPDSKSLASNPLQASAQPVNGAPARVSAPNVANVTAAPQPTAPAAASPEVAAASSGQSQVQVLSVDAQPEQQPAAAGVTAPAAPPATTATASASTTAAAPAPDMQNTPALQQITDSVKLIVQRGETEIRMQLYPKALGELHIQLHMTQEGTMAVRMLTETVQAQNLIHEHFPQLKSAFSAQGMQVTQMNVDVGSDSAAFYNQGRHTGRQLFNGSQHTPNYNRGYADESNPTSLAVKNQARIGSLNAIDYQA